MKQNEKGMAALFMHCFLPIFIYYIINNGVTICGMSVLKQMQEESVAGLLPSLVKMMAMVIGAMSVYSFFRREKVLMEVRKMELKAVLCLMVAGVVLSLTLNFLFFVSGFTAASEQYQQVAKVQFSLPFWLACIFYGMLSPVVEEMVFRGIVYNALCRHTTTIMGVIGSALLFGAFHGNVVQMIYGSLMGVVMACVYQRYRNLLAPIVFHGAANIVVYAMSYFF